MLKELYDEISKKLNKVTFESIWPGFHRYKFAIYTSEKVQFENNEIPWNNCFIGNTSIKYDGDNIAIWNVEQYYMNKDEIDIDILVSNIVHEMFHAYQFENGEIRFPQDLLTLNYPNSVENYTLKFEENKLLAEAFVINNLTKKKELLDCFCGIRKEREKIIGDMCQCEYLTETVEGMAEYAGLRALKMLSEFKYIKKTKDYIENIRKISSNQLDIRRISYFTGSILLLTSYDAKINFVHSILKQNKSIFKIISESLYPKFKNCCHYDPRIKLIIEDVENLRIQEVKKILNESNSKEKGIFYITGYDPMNMFKIDNYILCKNFIRLMNENTNETVQFMGKTLLEIDDKNINKVNCYYR